MLEEALAFKAFFYGRPSFNGDLVLGGLFCMVQDDLGHRRGHQRLCCDPLRHRRGHHAAHFLEGCAAGDQTGCFARFGPGHPVLRRPSYPGVGPDVHHPRQRLVYHRRLCGAGSGDLLAHFEK